MPKNIKSSLRLTLLKEKGPKDKNHLNISNFQTFQPKYMLKHLINRGQSITFEQKIKLLVFLGKFTFLQVYIHNPFANLDSGILELRHAYYTGIYLGRIPDEDCFTGIQTSLHKIPVIITQGLEQQLHFIQTTVEFIILI